MHSLLKKLISLAFLCCIIAPSTYAYEEGTTNVYQLPSLTNEEIENKILEYLNQNQENIEILCFIENKISSKISPMATSTPAGYTLLASRYYTKKDIGYAAGQYKNGVKFGSSGGSIYWTDSNDQVSVSLSAGIYGFSVGIGVGSQTSKVTGYAVNCQPNRSCKIRVAKDIDFKVYHVVYKANGANFEGDVPVAIEDKLYLTDTYVD